MKESPLNVPRYPLGSATALFSAGFRPFFLAAGVWAVIAMAVWIAMIAGFLALPSVFSPVTWHFHELLFGFVGAAMGGFLLTAVPNWTGRLPLQGWRLVLLTVLWLAGRIAVAGSEWIGPMVAALVDVSFFLVLAAVLAREIVAGRNWRNLPVLFALGFLGAANILVHVGASDAFRLEDLGKRFAIGVVVMLICIIGGRIVPSFTGNWLRKREASAVPPGFTRYDRASLIVTGAALVSWIALGLTPLTGSLLLIAALAQTVRLLRWRGTATLSEPLLWILHVGYAWVPLGLGLLGAAAWWPQLVTAALHALTAGAMGTMVIAVMTRASLGHTGRELTADAGTLAIYLLILVAVLSRLTAALAPDFYLTAVNLAGAAWIGGFALFVGIYGPLYLRRRLEPPSK